MTRPADFDLIEQAHHVRYRARVVLRIIALLGLAALCVTVPSIGPHRLWLAALLVALTPVPALLPVLFLDSKAMTAQSSFDVLSAGVLVWFVPDVWAAALVIVVASPAASAALVGKRRYLALESTGLGLVGLAGWGTDAPGWLVPWAVAAMLMPLIASYVDVFLTHEGTATSYLAEVVDSSPVIFWEVDATTWTVRAVTGRIEEILGWSLADGPLGIELRAIVHPEDLPELLDAVGSSAGTPVAGQWRFRRSDGGWVWLRVNVKRELAQGREVLRGIAYDVSELVFAHAEMRRRAERDELTGLANRAVLLETLRDRVRDEPRIALFLLDLDRFKDVNDTLGHHAGDAFLWEIARRLLEVVGPDDLVARLGGDEFAIVTAAPSGEVRAIAERIVRACEQPVALEGLDFSGSVSIGVALSPEHGTDTSTLLRRADLAMYASKRGVERVHVFDSAIDEPTVDRLTLSGEAEQALRRGELRLWFQPKVDLATGVVRGAEGLLRWHHPARGVLAPADFLDVVELSSHHNALAQEVIRQGIELAARTAALGRPLKVSVNVSIRNLLAPRFKEDLAAVLERYHADPNQLVLEVTEREIMDERGAEFLDTSSLRAMGVGLSIDDFGTGYSSLARLQQMKVSEIKIDRRFVSALDGDESAPFLVRSIVDLGKNLGHTIVAEGVEHPSEAALLRAMGCDLGQGFLFSPAVPVERIIEMAGEVFAVPAEVALEAGSHERR